MSEQTIGRQRTGGAPRQHSGPEARHDDGPEPGPPGAAPERRAGGEPPPPASVWADYLAAARELDAVRRGAAIAADEQAQSAEAAREELSRVRARLAPQQTRLRELGVPAIALAPAPPEVAAAARAMTSGPAAVLAALRGAAETADAADTVLAGRGPGAWPAARRNLLGYAPLAALGLAVQLLCHLAAAGGPAAVPALLGGLVFPGAAFGAGLLLIPRLFPAGPGERTDRTPRLGAVVCLAPAVLIVLGALLLG